MANRIEVYKALNDTYKDEALLELTGLAATHWPQTHAKRQRLEIQQPEHGHIISLQ